jgi:hypothetical protein
MQRRLHALAAFGHRLVGKADDMDVGLSGGDHHLHVHRHRLNALERNRAHARNHAALRTSGIAAPTIGSHFP